MLHACSHPSTGICPRDLLDTWRIYELVLAIFRGMAVVILRVNLFVESHRVSYIHSNVKQLLRGGGN